MAKCVAYCRVSSDSDEQLNSLDNQIKHYSELFRKEGFEGADCGMYYSKDRDNEIIKNIPSIFADEGISGTKLKNREAFKYMLQCAYRKEFEVIFVKNVQRWARSVEDGSAILKKLKVMGVKVIFEDGNLNNIEHEMVINMFLSVAQEESRAKSIAIQFGIRKAQSAGKFTSAPPFGYNLQNGYLRIIPDQAEVVKKIYNLYIEGLGGVRIARQLNNENIPTQKKKKWTPVQILYILENKIYIGKQITHTVVNTDINIDKVIHNEDGREYVFRQQQPVPEDDWIITENEDLRILSDEIFNEVQLELQKRKNMFKNSFKHSTDNIFSNLLYCRHCGGALRRKKSRGWKRKDGTRKTIIEWVCRNHDTYHVDGCEYRNAWHEEDLIKRVKNEIKNLTNNKDVLDDMFKDYLESFLSLDEVTDKINDLEQQLVEIKNIMSSNLQLFSKKIIDEEQYKQQNDELQINRKSIESELRKLRRIDEEREAARRKYNNYLEFINKVNYGSLDNIILKKVINKIEAYIIINDKGEKEKDIYINWNILDKSFDEIYYRKM